MRKKVLSLFLVVCMISSLITALPISAAAEANSCGDNLSWFFADGVLTITGHGDMTNYTEEELAPWAEYMDELTAVELTGEITRIGDYAFPLDYFIIENVIFNGTAAMWDLVERGVSNEAVTEAEIDFNYFTVTFLDLLGGVFSEQVVEKGCAAMDPGRPVALGAVFTGWKQDFTCVESDMIIEPMSKISGTNTGNMETIVITVADGDCGENVFWELHSDGHLVISGSGDMTDYVYYRDVRWDSHEADITKITIENGVTSIGDAAFLNCTALTDVTIPDSVTRVGKMSFQKCSSIKNITLPKNVESIGGGAFLGCTALESINIPDKVTTIEANTFASCKALKALNLKNITSIGDSPFTTCESLTSVTLSENLTSMGFSTFQQCRALTSITIPDSLTGIPNWAFDQCDNLTTVTIPDSITSIGNGTFRDCPKLTDIYYGGTQEQWSKVTVGVDNEYLKNATIHYNSVSTDEEGSEDNTGEDETDINKITVSKETASSGEEVTVIVKASENIGAAVGTMLISYDREMLELIDTSFGEMLENTSSIVNADYNDNGATKLYASFVGTENITAGGNLLTMTFKVNDEAEHDAVIPVTIDDIKFYSIDESLIELEVVNGEVHVVNYELGDVSKNDVIDLIDVLRIMQYDVGLRTFDKTELRLADVNKDDEVNIIDALMVQKFDAGLITEF